MYHANGKQRGTGGNSGDLKPLNRCEKMDIYQGERLNLAEAHNPKVAGSNPAPATK
jgi:hypothetical protein